jgi:hypothetical protein
LQLRLSRDHYLHIAVEGKCQPFAARRAVPAAQARPGQFVWVASGLHGSSAAAMQASEIVSVRSVQDEGLVNPFTLQGGLPSAFLPAVFNCCCHQ